MIDFWGHESLAKKISRELEKKEVPHTQLITDKYGGGGLFLAITIAEKLLGRDPFNHPDFYFCFPVIKLDKKTQVSQDLMGVFKSFYDKNNYCNSSDWLQSLQSSNKQGSISVEEVNLLQKKVNLRAYEGKNKVCVFWAPELLNVSAANKMLKVLEEPPSNTFFIMVSEKPELVLPTILSRSVILKIDRLPVNIIKERLVGLAVEKAEEISNVSGGSWRTALELSNQADLRKNIESIWVKGLRSAFKSKGNKSIVVELMNWAEEVSKLTRDEQKIFMEFGSELIRSALVTNYTANDASLYLSLNNFKIDKLAPFINSQNIIDITNLIDETYYSLKRNANSKILFSNFILKISRYLNKKEI